MVAVAILPRAEFGRNDYQEGVPHFIKQLFVYNSRIHKSGKFDCINDSMKVERKKNVILPQSPMFWDPTSDRSYQLSE